MVFFGCFIKTRKNSVVSLKSGKMGEPANFECDLIVVAVKKT